MVKMMYQAVKPLLQAVQKVKVSEPEQFIEALQKAAQEMDLHTVTALPVSIVSRFEKIKSKVLQEKPVVKALYSPEGDTAESHELQRLHKSIEEAPSLFQTIDLTVVTSEMPQMLSYRSKRTHDYWKRLSDTEHISVMVKINDITVITCSPSQVEEELRKSSDGQWSVESDLRDDMRSKKENPLLRTKPYIVCYLLSPKKPCSDVVREMLEHYFEVRQFSLSRDLECLVGYAATLESVSLRSFYRKHNGAVQS